MARLYDEVVLPQALALETALLGAGGIVEQVSADML